MNFLNPYIIFGILILLVYSFGFITLNKFFKIKSLIYLLALSFSLGTSTYLFIFQLIAFIFGPIKSTYISFLVLLVSVIFAIFKPKNEKFELEIEYSKNKLVVLLLIFLCVDLLSLICLQKYGVIDKNFHTPLVLTIFHNDIYPPRDFFRPAYSVLYHYGGDILAGAFYMISKVEIVRCYELICALFSGTIFLGYFLLSWTLSKSYKISLLSAFCTYFSGGLLWLDTFFRFFTKALPKDFINSGFIEVLFNFGAHGSVINPPSILTFVSTWAPGIAFLIFSLILFWIMINCNEVNKKYYILALIISLFSLYLTAEWLYLTFMVGVIPFSFVFIKNKDWKNLKYTFAIILTCSVLNKTFGNPFFLQDGLYSLGRANIFNIELKKDLFLPTWGRFNDQLNLYSKINILSWDFVCEFGLSLLLLPFAIRYIIKSKNLFGILLFLCAICTMPAPLIINFKTNPTDFNRMFGFGNTILVILIIIGLWEQYRNLFKKKIFIALILIGFCTSPILQLFINIFFTPYFFSDKVFSKFVFKNIRIIKSVEDMKLFSKSLNDFLYQIKYNPTIKYADTIKYLKENSNPGDFSVSSIPALPLYAGVYSLSVPGKFIYQDQIYSQYDSVFFTIFSTFDPHLLNELNLKWVAVEESPNNLIPINISSLLENKEIFRLVYSKGLGDTWVKIYHTTNIKNTLNHYKRKTAWVLINNSGEPVEIANLKTRKIVLKSSMKDALIYLKELQKKYPQLKRDLITAQTIIISEFESKIQSVNGLINSNISIEKDF